MNIIMPDYLKLIDKADRKHNPCQRADFADAFVDYLRDVFTDEELYDLINAKTEGRLVVLPCKVGDTVYFTQYICDYKHCDTHTRMSCCGCPDYVKNKIVIQSRKFSLLDLKDFGKTVFLSHKEAEQALKGESEC